MLEVSEYAADVGKAAQLPDCVIDRLTFQINPKHWVGHFTCLLWGTGGINTLFSEFQRRLPRKYQALDSLNLGEFGSCATIHRFGEGIMESEPSHLGPNDNQPPEAGGRQMPGCFVYPFFLVHMLAFGLSGFIIAYADQEPDLFFLYLHGGIAIFAYLIFYLVIFVLDEVKWMFINSGLGLFGIYAQIDLILLFFGKQASDFPTSVHVIPFLYYVLYTFLLYQVVLELSGARKSRRRKRIVELVYVLLSALVYGVIFLATSG
jgi:hypothetical protein